MNNTDPDRSSPGWLSLLTVVSWACPFLLVGSLYMTWAVAWVVLGHPPRPSADDPKSISFWVDIPYATTRLLLIVFPAAVIMGAILTVCFGMRHKARRVKIAVAVVVLVGLWVGTIAFLRWDPWRIGEWFMD